MNDRITHILAAITLAMPIILGVAHALKSIADRLYAYALTTPEKTDDHVVGRIVLVATWIDRVAMAVADVASLGVGKRYRNGKGES